MRTRIVNLLVLALLTVAPIAAHAGSVAQGDEAPQPAVVVEDESPAEGDDAWTFRYLVPTLLAMSGVALVLTIVVYGVRVRGRYRVVR